MAASLPSRKVVKVQIKKRQNCREKSTGYALRWTESGRRRSQSLAPYAY